MPPPTNQFTIDTSQGTNALQSVVDEFKKYNAEIDRVTEAHGEMDTSGKVLQATLQGVTKSGVTVVATLRDIGRGLEVVTTQANLAGKALDSITAAKLAKQTIGRTAASGQVQPKIESAFGTLPAKATTADINSIKNATRDLIESVKNGTIPAKTFFETLKQVAGGTKQIFTGTAGDVQQLLDRIQAAYRRAEDATTRFNDKQKTLNSKQRDLTLGQKAAPLAGAAIRKLFDFSTLDDRGLERVQAKITQVVNALEKAKISTKEFAQGFNQFKSGDIGSLSGGAEKVRASLASIRDIISGGGGGGGIDFAGFAAKASAAFHIVEAQVLFNSISRITEAFSQATQEAAEFQRGIALIQTISDDANLTFEQWGQGIRRVSDEFGRPIAEVAAANYDLLSNQVGKAADSFDTLRTAASFARITNSSVKDSVDLVSSAINAFRLTAGDAERITNTFFTTIDLGRIKAGELANTFGRVASVSHSLGLSLEETSASLTTLTRQGIQADTAQTLLLNLFQKMLNPTEKLQAEYDKLGVGTGDAFFKIYGLVGGLEKLNEITGGSTAKLAELQNELRGFQSANILTKNIDELKKDLAQIQNPGNRIDLAKLVTSKNFGQVFQDELNKVRNYYLTGFQTTILEGVLKITNLFGGLSKTTEHTFKIMGDAAGVFIATLSIGKVLQFAASLNFAAVSGFSFTAAMRAAAGAVTTFIAANPFLLIGAGIALLIKGAIDAKIAFEGLRAASKQAAEALEGGVRGELTKSITDRRNEFLKAAQDQQSTLLKGLSQTRIELNKIGEIQKDITDAVTKNVKNSFDVLTTSIKRVISDIEKEAARARSSITGLQDKLADLQRDRSSQIFERQLGTNQRNVENRRTEAEFLGQDPNEAQRRTDKTGQIYAARIDQLTKTAQAAYAKFQRSTGDAADKAKDQALASLDEINRLRDRQGQLEVTQRIGGQGQGQGFDIKRRQFGNEGDITKGFRQEVGLIEQIKAEEKRRAEAAEKQAADRRLDLEKYEDKVQEVVKFDPFNSEGKLKEKYKDKPGAALEDLKRQHQEALDAAQKFTSPLERAGLGETFRRQITDVRKALDEQFGNTKTNVAIQQLQKQADDMRDKVLEDTEQASKGFDKIKERVDAAAESITKLHTETATLVLQLAGLQDQQVEGRVGNLLNSLGITSPDGSTKAVEEIGKSIGKKNYRQAIADLDTYQKKLNEVRTQDGRRGGNLIAEPETATRPAQTANQVINTTRLFLESLARKQEGFNNDLKELDTIIRSVGGSGPKIAEVKTAIESLGGAFNVPAQASAAAKQKMLGDLDAVEAKISEILKKIGELNSEKGKALEGAKGIGIEPPAKPAVSAEGPVSGLFDQNAQYVQMGGRIKYYAAGGPVGRDTQLGYFDPEEFIMNRYSSRKFYSQLVQMNRGQSPKGGDGAGGNHLHVGEINVTESQGGQQTAQQVVHAINRGVRTGTLKVKR